METQTRFNLNAAIQNWQQELAAQSNLTMEARRELEAHVRDTVADLQKRGLNDEESFWLARRRVGQPDKLGEEFGKADMVKPWRKGLLWLAVALFAFPFWQSIDCGFYNIFLSRSSGSLDWLNVEILLLLFCWPVAAGLAISVVRGRSIKQATAWFSLIRSRRRFFVVACIWVVAFKSFDFQMQVFRFQHHYGGFYDTLVRDGFWAYVFGWRQALWAAVLIAIIVWLLPSEESGTFKRALRE
jgi:hypothetical protein